MKCRKLFLLIWSPLHSGHICQVQRLTLIDRFCCNRNTTVTIYLREKHIMASAIQVPLLIFHISLITHYQLRYAQDTDKYWSNLLCSVSVSMTFAMSCFNFVKLVHCVTIKSSIVVVSVCVIVYIQSFMFVYVDSPSVRCRWKYGWGEGRKQDGEGEAIPLGHSSRSVEVTVTHIWGISTERWWPTSHKITFITYNIRYNRAA